MPLILASEVRDKGSQSLAKETSNAGELWVRLRDSAIINKVEKISRMIPNTN